MSPLNKGIKITYRPSDSIKIYEIKIRYTF